MDVKARMNPNFRSINGGLFEKAYKADVGNALDELISKGAILLCWADPFLPDPSIPEHVKRTTIEGIQSGLASHYTKPIGNYELKVEIAKKLKRFNGMDVDPDRNILITPGSDSGLLFGLMPFIEPGDEVMVPDPSYPNNFLDPQLLGGVVVPVPLSEENGYQLQIKDFESRLSDRTKLILLTNPNNPTTTVFRREELGKLAELAVKHDLVVLVDQAFEDSVYDGRELVTMATMPGMWERTVTIFSVSKGMALSGYRVGYIVADDHIMDVLFGCAVNVIGATNTAAQLGAIAAMRDRVFIEEYNRIFERRRKIVFDIVNSIPGVSMAMPESSFMSWINISRLGTAAEVNACIIREANVVCNEGTTYGRQGEGHLRIVHGAYKDDAKVVEALLRIKDVLTRLAVEKGIAV
jgi:aspartate/methionine/tyrosine aminotransferase